MADVSVEEPEEIDVDVEAETVTYPIEESLPAAEPIVFSAAAEAVTDAPIVDAEPIPAIDSDEEPLEDGDIDGNRMDVEPTRIISRRKPAGARKTSPRTPAVRAPRTAAAGRSPRARKTGGRR
jgi:hypothetical protein